MQENRSFDHYFGTLRGVRGFNDPRAITLPSGKPVWFQPKDGGTVTPFPSRYARDQRAMHGRASITPGRARTISGRTTTAGSKPRTKMTMGYFKRHDIPFYHALADAFTICDAYHCSVFGPTLPTGCICGAARAGLTVEP